ncbi:DUF4917 family protein [Leifsonia sp. PS1209]|uniref:DUF4917 family protein n=1 Tax=Leifsonia sp. PS1209 TaxID=2724914 RepID=UPI001442A47D|nr:DUF4917 family protein [Leifsonia sp. PS1209]QIZ98634.1 DUF4917 family protein [Leifsonia sp. PS1209]
MEELYSFREAIADADNRYPERSVLLGNGFSVDYNRQIFAYDSLAQEASLAGLSVPKEALFETVGSSNFEVVVEKLHSAANLQRLYGGDDDVAAAFDDDADVVRNGLADALAARHPERAQTLSHDQVISARQFLSCFTTLFSLSYDLLLYWVINQETPGIAVPRADGFGWPSTRDKQRHIWRARPRTPQSVFFMHGALHFFVEDNLLRKLSFGNDGPLVDGLRARLDQGEYPLVVTEGTREEKEARIDKSPYLRHSLTRFSQVRGALFIHGASLSSNDDHVFDRIAMDTSSVEAIYISLRDPKSGSGRRVVDRAREIQEHRRSNGGQKLRVAFYDAASASVWRSTP